MLATTAICTRARSPGPPASSAGLGPEHSPASLTSPFPAESSVERPKTAPAQRTHRLPRLPHLPRPSLAPLHSIHTLLTRILRRPDTDGDLPPEFLPCDPSDPLDAASAPSAELFTASELSAAGEIEIEEAAPTEAQCTTHLLLLEAFWRWKDEVLEDQELAGFVREALGRDELGILDSFEHLHDAAESQGEAGDKEGNGGQGDKTDKDKEELWKLVLELAVVRYEAWWKAVGREVEKVVWEERRGAEEEGEGWKGTRTGAPEKVVREMREEWVPPIDVLLVWHTALLSPRSYYDDSLALGIPSILSLSFPWVHLHRFLSLTDLSYTLPASSSSFFTLSTSQDPSLIQHLLTTSLGTPRLPQLDITCPKCDADHTICISAYSTLQLRCICTFTITQPSLAAARLRSDIAALLDDGPGVRGTFSPPFSTGEAVNKELKAYYLGPPALLTHPTIADLLTPLPNPEAIEKFYLSTPPHSSSSISLSSAVIRQGVFIDKMHHFLWLRSPSLSGTVERATGKYRRFFELFLKFPGETMVPSLDTDLVWHTHLLSPTRYYYWATQRCDRWVGHDDDMGATATDAGWELTLKKWGEQWPEEEYGGCFCWGCEQERDGGDVQGWWGRRGAVRRRREWERRVVVEFWRAVERRRQAGEEMLAKSSLQRVIQEGPKRRR
ncbi:Similar to hypothetical protein ANI_1_1748144 [Aspergillus niger CBS 513.88]; acc. no. XP_001397795 [Pyronema omphalodes CBS 100304]|uniref:Uncharacterized protein n=1 Tax=Pyronema omphalodes (strain CBS 100304) TaxID=1076935 RepID=U4KXQ2_PYROM|nr:Similar to hypothetical protein ANI_1_1748144 [Aspergillus niger CBS 513.88]; acc. no. XP_001397795 [Pyronema omphalodes CBS 100304]